MYKNMQLINSIMKINIIIYDYDKIGLYLDRGSNFPKYLPTFQFLWSGYMTIHAYFVLFNVFRAISHLPISHLTTY